MDIQADTIIGLFANFSCELLILLSIRLLCGMCHKRTPAHQRSGCPTAHPRVATHINALVQDVPQHVRERA